MFLHLYKALVVNFGSIVTSKQIQDFPDWCIGIQAKTSTKQSQTANTCRDLHETNDNVNNVK